MGLYTSVQHPETGEEVQFKTGHDYCEWINLGEPVPWKIWPNKPGTGHLLDGVYWGTHCVGPYDPNDPTSWTNRDVWVIVKNHVLVAMPYQHAPREAWMLWYDIDEEPPAHWWTEEAWERRNAELKKAQEEYNRELAKAGGNPMQVFINHLMKGSSFMEQLLPPMRVKGDGE